jgi:hypothetical protein
MIRPHYFRGDRQSSEVFITFDSVLPDSGHTQFANVILSSFPLEHLIPQIFPALRELIMPLLSFRPAPAQWGWQCPELVQLTLVQAGQSHEPVLPLLEVLRPTLPKVERIVLARYCDYTAAFF